MRISVSELFKRYKLHIFTALSIIIIYVAFYVSGIGCPIKFFTGISCAGCGMTRAFFSVFTLDLKSAFFYHPLWFTIPITAFLLIFFRIKKKEKAYNAVLYVFAFLMLAIYIIRLFANDGDIVVFEPQNGAAVKFISEILRP